MHAGTPRSPSAPSTPWAAASSATTCRFCAPIPPSTATASGIPCCAGMVNTVGAPVCLLHNIIPNNTGIIGIFGLNPVFGGLAPCIYHPRCCGCARWPRWGCSWWGCRCGGWSRSALGWYIQQAPCIYAPEYPIIRVFCIVLA